MTRLLRLQPLTAEAFAPYGAVVEAPEAGARLSLEAGLKPARDDLVPRLSFGHPKPWPLPLVATEMERHAWSSQTFVPLDVARWVVMVAPDAGGAPDADRALAFLARGDQAVCYHAGAWHHPSRVLDRPGRFAVLMWSTGRKQDDEEWATLPEPIHLDV